MNTIEKALVHALFTHLHHNIEKAIDFEGIKALNNQVSTLFPNALVVGPGDDAAVFKFPDEETLLGAENRAKTAMKNYPQADYCVGIEGGVEEKGIEMYTFAWVVIISKKIIGRGKTASFLLPPKVVRLIKSGMELGDAMDEIFNLKNSKQKEGAIGILSGKIIDRKALYTPAIVSALIPFKKRSLYNK